MSEKLRVGINGFGRFGLHLLKYWLDRNEDTPWTIAWINDDTLPLTKAHEILLRDPYVVLNKYKLYADDGAITILEPNGAKHVIAYSQAESAHIPWIGEPDLFFECSGKNTMAEHCEKFLAGNTKQVLISATSWNADATLIYGFNHKQWRPDYRTISYGSCTVNAYVPLGQWFQDTFGVIDSDVNVVHNVARYKRQGETLIRKFCTLESMAPQLLEWLDLDCFAVNYTVVPYSGVSVMDIRFRCRRSPSLDAFIHEFTHASRDGGPLADLYGMDVADIGPEVYNCTTYSAVVIRNNIRVLGDNVYLHTYFDTENSVNRYYDLASHIAREHLGWSLGKDEGLVTVLSRQR